jgi:hypothetical protein
VVQFRHVHAKLSCLLLVVHPIAHLWSSRKTVEWIAANEIVSCPLGSHGHFAAQAVMVPRRGRGRLRLHRVGLDKHVMHFSKQENATTIVCSPARSESGDHGANAQQLVAAGQRSGIVRSRNKRRMEVQTVPLCMRPRAAMRATWPAQLVLSRNQ